MSTRGSIVQEAAHLALGTLDRCPVCLSAPAGFAGVCQPCRAWLEAAVHALPPPAGDWCWVGPYAGPLKRCVAAYKHGGGRRLAQSLGPLLALRLARWDFRPTLVVHVPASALRLEERGFDQADDLAAVVARLCRLPHASPLARSPVATSQKRLSRARRATNAGGAFGATRHVAGRVLLVDDVLTTGATFRACAAALHAAGATEVRGAFVARTVRSAGDGQGG